MASPETVANEHGITEISTSFTANRENKSSQNSTCQKGPENHSQSNQFCRTLGSIGLVLTGVLEEFLSGEVGYSSPIRGDVGLVQILWVDVSWEGHSSRISSSLATNSPWPPCAAVPSSMKFWTTRGLASAGPDWDRPRPPRRAKSPSRIPRGCTSWWPLPPWPASPLSWQLLWAFL